MLLQPSNSMHAHNLFFTLSPHTLYQNHEEFRQIFARNESTVYLTFSFLMHNTSHVCLNPMDRCYTTDAILCQQRVSKLVPKKDCLILKLLTKFKNWLSFCPFSFLSFLFSICVINQIFVSKLFPWTKSDKHFSISVDFN